MNITGANPALVFLGGENTFPMTITPIELTVTPKPQPYTPLYWGVDEIPVWTGRDWFSVSNGNAVLPGDAAIVNAVLDQLWAEIDFNSNPRGSISDTRYSLAADLTAAQGLLPNYTLKIQDDFHVLIERIEPQEDWFTVTHAGNSYGPDSNGRIWYQGFPFNTLTITATGNASAALRDGTGNTSFRYVSNQRGLDSDDRYQSSMDVTVPNAGFSLDDWAGIYLANKLATELDWGNDPASGGYATLGYSYVFSVDNVPPVIGNVVAEQRITDDFVTLTFTVSDTGGTPQVAGVGVNDTDITVTGPRGVVSRYSYDGNSTFATITYRLEEGGVYTITADDRLANTAIYRLDDNGGQGPSVPDPKKIGRLELYASEDGTAAGSWVQLYDGTGFQTGPEVDGFLNRLLEGAGTANFELRADLYGENGDPINAADLPAGIAIGDIWSVGNASVLTVRDDNGDILNPVVVPTAAGLSALRLNVLGKEVTIPISVSEKTAIPGANYYYLVRGLDMNNPADAAAIGEMRLRIIAQAGFGGDLYPYVFGSRSDVTTWTEKADYFQVTLYDGNDDPVDTGGGLPADLLAAIAPATAIDIGLAAGHEALSTPNSYQLLSWISPSLDLLSPDDTGGNLLYAADRFDCLALVWGDLTGIPTTPPGIDEIDYLLVKSGGDIVADSRDSNVRTIPGAYREGRNLDHQLTVEAYTAAGHPVPVDVSYPDYPVWSVSDSTVLRIDSQSAGDVYLQTRRPTAGSPVRITVSATRSDGTASAAYVDMTVLDWPDTGNGDYLVHVDTLDDRTDLETAILSSGSSAIQAVIAENPTGWTTTSLWRNVRVYRVTNTSPVTLTEVTGESGLPPLSVTMDKEGTVDPIVASLRGAGLMIHSATDSGESVSYTTSDSFGPTALIAAARDPVVPPGGGEVAYLLIKSGGDIVADTRARGVAEIIGVYREGANLGHKLTVEAYTSAGAALSVGTAVPVNWSVSDGDVLQVERQVGGDVYLRSLKATSGGPVSITVSAARSDGSLLTARVDMTVLDWPDVGNGDYLIHVDTLADRSALEAAISGSADPDIQAAIAQDIRWADASVWRDVRVYQVAGTNPVSLREVTGEDGLPRLGVTVGREGVADPIVVSLRGTGLTIHSASQTGDSISYTTGDGFGPTALIASAEHGGPGGPGGPGEPVSGGTASRSSRSSSQSHRQDTDFWTQIKAAIVAAEKGGTVIANAPAYVTKLPADVLALLSGRDCTLIIQWAGGTIVIYGGNVMELDPDVSYYTLEFLASLYGEGTANQSGSWSEPNNPATGGDDILLLNPDGALTDTFAVPQSTGDVPPVMEPPPQDLDLDHIFAAPATVERAPDSNSNRGLIVAPAACAVLALLLGLMGIRHSRRHRMMNAK